MQGFPHKQLSRWLVADWIIHGKRWKEQAGQTSLHLHTKGSYIYVHEYLLGFKVPRFHS